MTLREILADIHALEEDMLAFERKLAPCILFVLLVTILAMGRPVLAQQATRVIFLHHSCGENLINQGGVREGLTALGYEFYDHGYNGDGLRLADGSYTGTNFDVPGDNTDPDGFAAIFAQPLHDPPDNTFSHLMQYDVIAFKSCFPVSNIADDYQLNEYKSYYLSIRDRMDQYPDKVFIIVTQPPQVPVNSDPAEAARARAFVNWLQSDEYLAGRSNVFVFDFFGYLAGDDNFLRPEYRLDEYDAHPNERANRAIGPLFVSFIDQAVRVARAGGLRPTPTAPPTAQAVQPSPSVAPTVPPAESTQPPPPVAPPVGGAIDDFESTAGHWETDAETGSTVECGPDADMAHGGEAALRIHYDIAPGGWVDCGRYFESVQDWSEGAGVSLSLRGEGTARWVTLMLFAGDPDAPTPFEVDIEIVSDDAQGWREVGFPWTSFERAEWADEAGLTELDPARVTGFGFSLGADEGSSEGVLWIDDLYLSPGVAPPLVIPTATPTTATAPPVEEGESGGGVCPSAALALSVGALTVLLAGCRRR